MKLKVFADRMSQPSRAVIIFCKVNDIDYEEITVEILKNQHLTPKFTVTLFLSILLLHFLELQIIADLSMRSKIHSVLDWHHSNLRRGAATYVRNTVLAPVLHRPSNPQAAAVAEKLLSSSLSMIKSFWLKGSGCFLLGGNQPSIADLSLDCELMQLELLDEKDHTRLLAPYKKVEQWIKNTRNATSPHFDDVHEIVIEVKKKLQDQRPKASNNGGGSGVKNKLLNSRL